MALIVSVWAAHQQFWYYVQHQPGGISRLGFAARLLPTCACFNFYWHWKILCLFGWAPPQYKSCIHVHSQCGQVCLAHSSVHFIPTQAEVTRGSHRLLVWPLCTVPGNGLSVDPWGRCFCPISVLINFAGSQLCISVWQLNKAPILESYISKGQDGKLETCHIWYN